jgi:hypothetical protein
VAEPGRLELARYLDEVMPTDAPAAPTESGR